MSARVGHWVDESRREEMGGRHPDGVSGAVPHRRITMDPIRPPQDRCTPGNRRSGGFRALERAKRPTERTRRPQDGPLPSRKPLNRGGWIGIMVPCSLGLWSNWEMSAYERPRAEKLAVERAGRAVARRSGRDRVGRRARARSFCAKSDRSRSTRPFGHHRRVYE